MVKEPFESRPVGGGVCGGRGLLFKQKPSVVVFELLFYFFLIFEEHLGKPKISKKLQLAEKMGLT